MNNETLRIILGYLFAFFLTGGSFWFLYQAFLNPNTFALPENQQTVLVAAMVGFINLAAGFVFQQVAAAFATRAAERNQAAGVNAALQTPPAPTVPAPPDGQVNG